MLWRVTNVLKKQHFRKKCQKRKQQRCICPESYKSMQASRFNDFLTTVGWLGWVCWVGWVGLLDGVDWLVGQAAVGWVG